METVNYFCNIRNLYKTKMKKCDLRVMCAKRNIKLCLKHCEKKNYEGIKIC